MFKLALSALAAFALLAPAAQAANLTPLTASVLATPEPATGTDGKRHLVYELRLANQEGVPLELQSLTVSSDRGRTLASYDAAHLPEVMSTHSGATSTLAPDQAGTVWIDLAFPIGSALPRALEHRFTGKVGELAYAFDGARTRVGTQRPLTVDAPLRGGRWLNFNGCCATTPHRTAIAPVDGIAHLSERFAADFIQIDAHGRAATGDLSRNEAFFAYGKPVYAVADGRVVSALNTLAENTPLNEPPGSAFNLRTILGNSVVLELADGTYAAYGHLMTGSVLVRPGQRVRRGDRLAQVGNTGQSGAPHLHFQLSDGPDPVASDGRPYAFRAFRHMGMATNVEQFLMGAAPAEVVSDRTPNRREQMPMHASVIDFG
jgi:hypothetical protein